ncbi:MAG: PcfJ domain-containing protein [Streptococcus salivarius]
MLYLSLKMKVKLSERKHLHHCVGRYAKEHFVYGSSIIVFVRDKTDRETPLYA